MLKSINPYNNEQFAEYEEWHDAQVTEAIERNHRAFKQWRNTPLQERLNVIDKLATLIDERKYELAKLATLEMGKLYTEAVAEVQKCGKLCRYYVEHAEEHLKRDVIESRFGHSHVQYDPLGVILGVMPWNFPFWQVIRFAVPALTVGNTCLLKHASNVYGCAFEIEKLFLDAGLPKECFIVLPIGSDKVDLVIANGLVRGVSLTGSEGAGSAVAATAGKHLKKTVLELGGNDPFIVLDDADIDDVVSDACRGRLGNTGQSCIAAKRFFIHQAVYGDVLQRLINKFSTYQPGDPMNSETNLAPLAKDGIANTVMEIVDDARAKGATIEVGGSREGNFVYPTIITGLTKNMRGYDEEIFGPVAVVYPFDTVDDVIEMANDSRYGLASAVFTKDLDKAEYIAGKLENGSVYINSYSVSDPALPFGGVKQSGYGREMSKHGLLEFVNVKTVVID
jgi:succinate-semialdehyde dehydrogenase / glutarate-semialdehyde dehydrogenase